MVSVVRWPCHLFYLARIFVFASPTLPPCHGNKWYMVFPFLLLFGAPTHHDEYGVGEWNGRKCWICVFPRCFSDLRAIKVNLIKWFLAFAEYLWCQDFNVSQKVMGYIKIDMYIYTAPNIDICYATYYSAESHSLFKINLQKSKMSVDSVSVHYDTILLKPCLYIGLVYVSFPSLSNQCVFHWN